ncbi:hypothetical protein [Dactylosporangium sp. CA-139066]|uniref:hypothetical protein n=1 Tax=Dactylosporangium sp. CA-139066 TaxID=3239930 RepID=UPI003D91E7CB
MAFGLRRRALLAACRDGRELRGGILDAGVLRDCCLDATRPIDPRGLRLHGVHVRGRLDLAGVDAAFPLAFTGCTFDEAPDLTGASVRGLAITGSPRLPGLLADGLRVAGDLDLSGSRIAGAHRGGGRVPAAVWLRDADVGRRLLLLGTAIDAGGARALHADRIRVGGNARLANGFAAGGDVRLPGARIGGSLDLGGARIAGGRAWPDERPAVAVDLGEATIAGSLFLAGHPADSAVETRLEGRFVGGNLAVAGRMVIRGAVLHGPGGEPALTAPRLTVGGALNIEGGCRFRGGIDLSYGDLTTVTIGGDCAIDAPGRIALDLRGAEVRSHVTLRPASPSRARCGWPAPAPAATSSSGTCGCARRGRGTRWCRRSGRRSTARSTPTARSSTTRQGARSTCSRRSCAARSGSWTTSPRPASSR